MRFCVFALVQVVCAEEVRPLVRAAGVLHHVGPVLEAGALRAHAKDDPAWKNILYGIP